MARVTVQGLTKSYGGVNCLSKVDLEIEDGQLAVIVGPSGCGKTTLLRCIAGLEKFSEGSILIDDELINEKEPKDRDVAMVFQYYALYPHMTVYQNMSLGLQHTTKLSKGEIRKRVEDIAEVLQISKLLKRKPGELSGGESQRVAIGRALVRDPKVFLLDEPLTAIDTKLRRELRGEIKRIQRKFGVTTLYITHDQEEAMAIGDLLVVVADGVIHQIGSPEEVYTRPTDRFVAGFIGRPKMNFLELKVDNRQDGHFLRNASMCYEISERFYCSYLAGLSAETLVAGIRPHSLRPVHPNERVPSANKIAATVSLVENMGKDRYLYLDVSSERIVAKLSHEFVARIGDALQFTFEEEDMCLFDADTGQSLMKRH
jgi:multiple sugar transport system ATP-binding protein